ncbi:MAG: hypothetical protein GKR87_00490 [Kiritimatiellae bacterium]|nr:hypothetical protein [Kiritimatiellia bacterium]
MKIKESIAEIQAVGRRISTEYGPGIKALLNHCKESAKSYKDQLLLHSKRQIHRVAETLAEYTAEKEDETGQVKKALENEKK